MFIFVDLVLETIISEGLDDMRNNLDDRLNIIFAQLKESYLNAEYGQTELNRFKTFLTNETIQIVHSYRQIEQRLPCIYIQPVGGGEQEPKSFINDYSGDTDTLGGGGTFISDRKEEKTLAIQDQIQVGIHVGDPGGITALRWLYASLVYYIFSRKEDLVSRGIDLSTWNTTDFNRLNELLENVYSRYLTFNCLNYVSWTKRESETIITDIDMHGGVDASEPGQNLGGIKIKSTKDKEYEEKSVYTIDK